ncbi:Pyridoxine/pyridoxamine 5'-phosphate oxidase 2 [Sesamum alatum]|uniref:pyridoxal 5'-phosphate synthase n=1 Tax=Sesamum alatum TaxID=300844 RepID=A0AAE1XQI4_9LAMI|nr:Pyridoxine/pyridoxamine 5'-phosphate oxidase 2 [Sesamum alatum]
MGSSAAAPWKQLLLSSIQSNSHLKHHSYFQLATVASNGRPSNRTVVFRGFQDDDDKILINTDNRSRKIDELEHCPFAEICWYFTESWEQFRINGSVDVIDGTNLDPLKLEQREKSWFACSPKSRLQYMAPTPRLPSLNELPSETPSSMDPSIGPVAAFCLLVLDPAQIDYLNLKSNERLIFTSGLSSDGEKLWTSEKVNP